MTLTLALAACSEPLPVFLEPPADARSVLLVSQVGDRAARIQAAELAQGLSTPLEFDAPTRAHALFLAKSLAQLTLPSGDVKQDPAGRTLELLGSIRSQYVDVVDDEAGRWSPLQAGVPSELSGVRIEGTPCKGLAYFPAELPVANTRALAGWASAPNEVSLVLANGNLLRAPRFEPPELIAQTATVSATHAWMDAVNDELWMLRSDGWVVVGPPLGPFEKRTRLDRADTEAVEFAGGIGADGPELYFGMARGVGVGELLRWSSGRWSSLWRGERDEIPNIAWIGSGQAVASFFGLRLIEVEGDALNIVDLPLDSAHRNTDVDWVHRLEGLGPLAATGRGEIFLREAPGRWTPIFLSSAGASIGAAAFLDRTLVLGGSKGIVHEVVLGFGECKSEGIAFDTNWDGIAGEDHLLIYRRSITERFAGFWIDPAE
ncbi:MAG: hypothetical protein HY791_27750 [Deltaproteobacteria bacterium]|nr:hypothetical protein [Deltaproteobacteria bacterium]